MDKQEEKSLTWWNDKDGGTLPERATIVFNCKGGRIDVRLRNGELFICSEFALVIKPRASNNIKVSVQ